MAGQFEPIFDYDAGGYFAGKWTGSEDGPLHQCADFIAMPDPTETAGPEIGNRTACLYGREDEARKLSEFWNSLTPSELWELCPEFFA